MIAVARTVKEPESDRAAGRYVTSTLRRLLRPGAIEQTAVQMEYLPSGLRCDGTVTKADAFGFTAVCKPTGAHRFVTAQWQGTGSAEITAGSISSHP